MEIRHSSFSRGSSARVDMEVTEQALKCPICVDVFTKPIRLPCGHNFCRSCILIVWDLDDDTEAGPRFCPECQIFLPSDLKLNLNTKVEQQVQPTSTYGHVEEHTASASNIMCDQCIERSSVAVKNCLNCDALLCSAHTLCHQNREPLRGHTLIDLTEDLLTYKCQEHKEEKRLFCQDDQTAVCSLCVLFGTHKGHKIIQLKDACLDFKKALEERDAELLHNRHLTECALEDLQRLVSETSSSAKECRVKIAEIYSQMKALIVKDQQLMIDIIEMEEDYTQKWLLSKREFLEQQIKDLNSLLSESKALLQENDQLKFLKHFKRHTFSSANLKPTPLPLVNIHTCKMETVQQLVETFYETVFQITKRIWANMRAIHLDVDTAHPNLKVSSDLLEVQWSKLNTQESKDKEHFSTDYSILAKESFLNGSHYWETAVWEKPYWLIGLSYGSGTQTGKNNATPERNILNKICYIYNGNGRYLVCNGNKDIMLEVEKEIQKVGVNVEIEKGTVSFYDADTMKLLHLFAIEYLSPVRPLFNPCLCLNKQNAQALILLNRKGMKEVIKVI